MPSDFPPSVATFTTKVDGQDYPQAAHINSLQDEVVATQTEVLAQTANLEALQAQVDAGVGSSTPSTWTPTWTNLTVGNGTVIARYHTAGPLCRFLVSLTCGSTTSLNSNTVEFTLPVAAVAYTNMPIANSVYAFASNNYIGYGMLRSSGLTCFLIAIKTNATYGTADGVCNTIPATFVSNTQILVRGQYFIS